MRFIARYINKETGDDYHRTVFADDVNEATKKAERMTRKDCLLVSVCAEY